MTLDDKESLTGKLLDLAPSVIESVKETVGKQSNNKSETENEDKE
jgi:uncharacterized spore protein YtfJ